MSDFRALFMVLSDPDKTEQVLDILLQCEIRGATIIDSLGMGQIMVMFRFLEHYVLCCLSNMKTTKQSLQYQNIRRKLIKQLK